MLVRHPLRFLALVISLEQWGKKATLALLKPDNQASCFSHEKEEISLGIYQASTMHDRWLVALASLWLYYTKQYNALDYIKGM